MKSEIITLGIRLPKEQYAKIKDLADKLNLSLSLFGEQALMSAVETIETESLPEIPDFIKGSRYWIHDIGSKQNYKT